MDIPINDIDTLIKEIERKYPYSTDSRNFAEYIRGVSSKMSVHDIISTIVTVIDGISKYPYLMSECKSLLYGYMNERLLKWYEDNESLKIESFCEAYINIRDHENKESIKEKIVKIAESRGLIVDNSKVAMKAALNEFNHNYSMLKGFSYKSNGYNQYLPLAKAGAAKLLDYRFDACGLPYSLGSFSNIFKEVRDDRKREKEKEEEKRRQEKEEKDKTTALIVGTIVGVAIIVGLSIWMESLEGGIILFIIIFAIIKLYAGLLK